LNTFVAIFHRSQKYVDHHRTENFHRYLPLAPEESNSYHSPNKAIQIFSFNIGKPLGYPPLITFANSACAIDGILLPLDESLDRLEPEALVQELAPQKFDQAMGEYSLVYSNGEELFSTSDIGGSHSLYLVETDNLVAISNRSVCLLGVAGISHSLDENGHLWKAYQGYITSPHTAFKDIKKIRNGSKVTVSRSGNLQIQQSSYSELIRPRHARSLSFQDNPQGAFQDIIQSLSSYLRRTESFLQAPYIDLPLSGGKDSRVILSLLLKAGLQNKMQSIWTRGTLYSPEVLAAKDLCQILNLSKIHEVHRPPYSTGTNLRTGMVVRTLNNHEGLVSLYDFAGITPSDSLRIQGIQSIYRSGKFPNCRLDSYEHFLEDALKTYRNPLNVVRDTAKLESEIDALFQEQLADGAPLEDLGDLWELFERLPSWAAVLSNTHYCSGPITNPLIMGEFCRFAFSIPPKFRRGEVFHFLSLYFNAPELLDCPFAEQVWPENIRELLREIGIDYSQPLPRPYKTHGSFPNLKNPWIPNLKLEYYKALKPFVLDVLEKKKSTFSSLLDMSRLTTFLECTDSPQFIELYPAMGIFSAVILEEYGSDIFDRTQHHEIQKDLESRMKMPTSETNFHTDTQEKETWEEMLTRHEQSIAELVRAVQKKPS
jgi:hypothetical protein